MSNIPKIRFKGFTEEWEQHKVGDFMIESRESGHKGDQARKLTVKLWGKGVYEKDEVGSVNTQYFRRHSNQFIYSKLDFLNCAFGVVPESLEGLETTADVPAFDSNGINPYFMFFTAIQPDFYLKNGMIADGSRKAKRIHADTFLNMPIVLPCLDEQEKIVRVLKQLDHLITLHQRKYDEITELKKYMLKKMFPEEGKNVPEIRFAGFTEDWERRKLDELSEFITKGATPTTYGFEWQTSGIPFFRNDAIKNNRFIYGDYSYISKEANEVLKRSEIHANDILIAITGDIGKVGIIPENIEKGNINQHIARVRVTKDAIPYFIYQSLCIERQQRKYQLIKTGLSMPQLSLEQIRETVVLCPSLSEQEKIGEYFCHIDHLITLHQQKLDELTELKKYMLQNMFPKKEG